MTLPAPIVEDAKRNPSSIVTSARLFERDDAAVVAVGPSACLRLLYFQALKAQRLSRLYLCPISREEYALGRSGERVKARCTLAASAAGVRAVILYVSCADLLSGVDFESLTGEVPLPVFVFRRGPLQKRKCPPSKRLAEIFAEIDALPSAGPEAADGAADCLPPLASDYSGVCSELNGSPLLTTLCTPGGCASCLYTADDFREPDFALSRGDDLQAASGWNGLGAAAANLCRVKRKKTVLLAGTPVMSMTGLDFEHQEKIIRNGGLEAVSVETDGFSAAPAGVAKLYRSALGRLARSGKGAKSFAEVFGGLSLRLGTNADLRWIVRALEDAGAELRFFAPDENGRWNFGAALSLVAAAEGLEAARSIQAREGTPLLAGLPVGRSGARRWTEQLHALLGRVSNQQAEAERPKQDGAEACVHSKALILAEPLLAVALRRCLLDDFGFSEVEIALYAPDRETRGLYRSSFCGGEELPFFSTPSEIAPLARETGWIIADPLYRLCLPLKDGARFLPLPQRELSGDLFKSLRVPLFGEAGFHSLKSLFLKHTTSQGE